MKKGRKKEPEESASEGKEMKDGAKVRTSGWEGGRMGEEDGEMGGRDRNLIKRSALCNIHLQSRVSGFR